MDEYGCFRATKEDWESLATLYKATRNIVFAYSEDQIGCYVISLNGGFTKFGIMPFGGSPEGRIWVGVFGKGSSHLGWASHASYVGEKLGLARGDAEQITRLLNELGTRVTDS